MVISQTCWSENELIGIRRAYAKILILVPLAVFASALAIGPGGLVSYSPATRVGVHSLLAFWISIPATPESSVVLLGS